MKLEHLTDLELRYESNVTMVRPYGSAADTNYRTNTGVATNPTLTKQMH